MFQCPAFLPCDRNSLPAPNPAVGAGSSAGPSRGCHKLPTQKINEILAHLLLFVFHRAFGRDFQVVLPQPPPPPSEVKSENSSLRNIAEQLPGLIISMPASSAPMGPQNPGQCHGAFWGHGEGDGTTPLPV